MSSFSQIFDHKILIKWLLEAISATEMDKIRSTLSSANKRPKTKGHPAPALDLIPLGQRRDAGEGSSSRLALSGVKRDSSVPISLLAKRPKTAGGFSPQRSDSPSTTVNVYKHEEHIIECPLTDLHDRVEETGDDSNITDGLISGALKHLRLVRHKPNPKVIVQLLNLAKSNPTVFTTDSITTALCSLLKKDVANAYKAKGNPTVTVLVCNILYASFADDDHWPQQFVEAYLEDSLGDRLWVDRSDCKCLVDNICTAFSTNMTPKNPTLLESVSYTVSLPGTGSTMSPGSSPFHSSMMDSGEISSDTQTSKPLVRHRYRFQLDSTEQMVSDVIHEQIVKRQHLDVGNKALLKLLTSVCGYSKVRQVCLGKLETWLQNSKLTKAAQDLLLSLCLNCSGQDQHDKDVLIGLLKLRLKNKQLVTHYLACLRELLEHGDENLRIMMTHTIYNELSTGQKNPNNMQILGVMFQQAETQAPQVLADVFMELLMNGEDYLRALRGLLREIVRTLRSDVSLHPFCAGLMVDRSLHTVFISLDSTIIDRVIRAIANLVALCQLLAITPSVRESASQQHGSRKDIHALHTFWRQTALIQREAAIWVHETILRMHPQIQPADFVHCLYHTLMMAEAETYYKVDGWPNESERSTLLRLVSETPVLEETLVRVLMLGLEPHFVIKPSEALEVCELMVNRAAALHGHNYPVLEIDTDTLMPLLLTTPIYKHPDNITLPHGYTPPRLAITDFFWKMWTTILVMASMNPTSIGEYVWKEYPSARSFMEMVMTGSYTFPPISTASSDLDGDSEIEQLIVQERQITEMEKQEILEFEGHLAASTSEVVITENNSLLLSQLISINPSGPARKPPQAVLEKLQSLDKSLKLGQVLCKSRNPDFLMDLINKQGARSAMPWLSRLVQSNEGSLDVLPIQCLCEFLLYGMDDETTKQVKKVAQQERLLHKLQSIISQADYDEDSDHLKQSACKEVLEYFFSRLYSTDSLTRRLSSKALMLLFTPPSLSDSTPLVWSHSWLLEIIPDLKVYESLETLIESSLHKALLLETNLSISECYIRYLLNSRLYHSEQSNTILVLSQLFLNKPTLTDKLLKLEGLYQLLVSAYAEFIKDAQNRKSAFEWAEHESSVMIDWGSHTAVLHMSIIHASILLICYTCTQPQTEFSALTELREYWFPTSTHPPVGLLTLTSELAQLYTSDLKLTMVQTGHKDIVSAAVQEATLKELLILVQSFGIPDYSLNLILHHIEPKCNDLAQSDRRLIDSQKPFISQYLTMLKMNSNIKIPSNVCMVFEVVDIEESMETTPSSDVTTQLKTENSKVFSDYKILNNEQLTPALTQFMNMSSKSSELRPLTHTLLQTLTVNEVTRKQFLTRVSAMRKDGLVKFIKEKTTQFGRLLQIACATDSTEKNQLLAQLSTLPNLPKSLSNIIKSLTPSNSSSVQKTSTAEDSFNEAMSQLYIDGKLNQAVKECITQIDTEAKGHDLSGLATDWLELIDPEINSVDSELQTDFIFARPENRELMSTDGKNQVECKRMKAAAHLRSLLTHQTRWSSLRSTLKVLLSTPQTKIRESRDAEAVLNFITDCRQHPVLFQGREQNKSQAPGEDEDILHLTHSQLITLSEYICTEQRTSSLNTEALSHLLIRRVKLLSTCTRSELILQQLTDYLENKALLNTGENSEKSTRNMGDNPENTKIRIEHDSVIYRRILVLLYCLQPNLISHINDESLLYQDMRLTLTAPCSLDKEIHAALCAFSCVKAGKKHKQTLSNANLVCRRLAAHHPVLFLRHAGVLSSLVSARMFSTYGEFVTQNRLILYTYILGLIELLQPHIYKHDEWSNMVHSYFTLIKVHGLENDDSVCSVFVKFFMVLYSYYNTLPNQCINIINKYKHLLSELQRDPRFSKTPQLKTLSTASFLPATQENLEIESRAAAATQSLPLEQSFSLAKSITAGFTIEQITPTLRRLRTPSSNDDIIAALVDLDLSSKKRVEILSPFQDEIKCHMTSINRPIREQSFKLLKRYISYNPKSAHDIVTPLMGCLEGDNPDVVKTAIIFVTELALVMSPEDRKKLLITAFNRAAFAGLDESIHSLKHVLHMTALNAYSLQK